MPDTREITDKLFDDEASMPGIDLNEAEQLKTLSRFRDRYREEYDKLDSSDDPDSPLSFRFQNDMFETVDVEILYCMIRECKPSRLIEIGSGQSTKIASAAIRKNRENDPAYECELTCVEPFHNPWLEGIPEVTRVIRKRVEEVPVEEFGNLESGDILFIDSSHTINVYNDVCYEYLEILPTLQPGVTVHIHDIVLPQRYSRKWLENLKFWNEQYLLQALLVHSPRWQVVWAAHAMHLHHPNALAGAFASYRNAQDSSDDVVKERGHKSFWIRTRP